MDTSNKTIGGVLVQEGHPITFESWKLKDVEQRYSTYEKEMTTVVHYLATWQHYLFRTLYTIVTNIMANTYFRSQKKLSSKLVRWQEFFAEFDFKWAHKPKRQNIIANVLSQKEVEGYVVTLTFVVSDFIDKVHQYIDSTLYIVDFVTRFRKGSYGDFSLRIDWSTHVKECFMFRVVGNLDTYYYERHMTLNGPSI